MKQTQLELFTQSIKNGLLDVIVCKVLKTLESKGNDVARRLLFREEFSTNYEDLKQVVSIAILENLQSIPFIIDEDKSKIFIDFEKLKTENEVIFRDIFASVSKCIYSEKRNNNTTSPLYITIDGNNISITDYKGISQHTDFDEVVSLSEYNSFLSYVFATQKKDVAFSLEKIMELLILGYKDKEISNELNMSLSLVKKRKSILRNIRKEYLKTIQ